LALPISVIVNVAPEFTNDDRLAFFLQMAEDAHTASVFAGQYSYAMGYYAAHMMATTPTADGEGNNQAQGALISRKAGDVERQWASPAVGTPWWYQWLATTIYGQRYLMILRSRAETASFLTPVSW